jgi:hypothetical protein
MMTLEQATEMDALERADEEAVMQHFFHGVPLDPEVSRRVEERARVITDEIRRMHGDDIDVDQLFRDDDDES